ncbi:DUF6203 family protein [Nonomuraea fuscirosea]|uniref:DUF6203 family protein n=1 Tax=Nonomuraea fuscirosea TaxID=1291556 RepID=UPI0034431060
MKKFLKLVVARYLSKTPFGLVVLGIGWFLGRRHKRRRAERENAPMPRRATPARRPGAQRTPLTTPGAVDDAGHEGARS